MKGMGYDAGMIAGRQQGRRNAPFQKILHLLGRGFLHASSGTAGSRLQRFLVRHARQHPVFPAKRFRIFRMHADYKTGIGKWRIPPGQRHAVDHYLIVLRGGGHDEAAGTHAEGMDAAVLDGGRHGITGCRKLLRAPLLRIQVVLARINKRLGMLNAHTHGKGFLFQSQPLRQHHAVHVPGTVPGSQQNGIRRKFPAIRAGHAAYAAAVRRTEQHAATRALK